MHINRRSFASFTALGIAGTAISSIRGTSQVPATEQEFPLSGVPRLSKEEWLDQAIERANHPSRDMNGVAVFGRFRDRTYWLEKPISWRPSPEMADQRNYPEIKVPIGFVTDLASIPWYLYSFLPPDGDYAIPAVVHDYLYWTQRLSKDKADNIFRFSMQDYGIGSKTRYLIYEAVHLRGFDAWRANAKAKEQGERRILARFPSNSNVTWAEWKRKPQNFE